MLALLGHDPHLGAEFSLVSNPRTSWVGRLPRVTCAIVTVLTLPGSYTCFTEVPRNLVPGSVSNMQMEMGLQCGC